MSEFVHSFTWTVPAARREVYIALTQADALRQWFAEHVEIESRSGGAFHFWGKHTLDSPLKDKASQTITEFEDGRLLSFSWRLFNTVTDVQLVLECRKNKNETIVNGTHRLQRLPAISRAKEMIDDLWRLHGGNLSAYLAGGDGISLPDYDDTSHEIRQSIIIDAARTDVFKALITPRLLKKWMWGENPAVDAKKGGKYTYNEHANADGKNTSGGPTRILDYIENELLITDWLDWRGDISVPAQTITWQLEDAGIGKTRVTVIHSGFIRAVDISDYPFGWATFLGRLKTAVETHINFRG